MLSPRLTVVVVFVLTFLPTSHFCFLPDVAELRPLDIHPEMEIDQVTNPGKLAAENDKKPRFEVKKVRLRFQAWNSLISYGRPYLMTFIDHS